MRSTLDSTSASPRASIAERSDLVPGALLAESNTLAQGDDRLTTEASAGSWSLIDMLLRDQADLSAVERFSKLYESDGLPPLAQRYEALLPATPLREGEQLAFEVDLDRCSGC